MSESGENEKAAFIRDVETLSAMGLIAKYKTAHTSWRNSKQRASAGGNWSPAFDVFRDFLRIMGPPDLGHTLDRIDPHNPMYAPGLVRWASKQEQGNNRKATRFVDHRGVVKPLSDAARAEGIRPDTLRQTLRRQGNRQTFESFINAVNANVGYDPRKYQPWPASNFTEWENLWLEAGGIARAGLRYAFLIRILKKGAQEADARLYSLYEAGVEVEDPRYQEDLLRSRRCEEALRKAQHEFPIWKAAVMKFEGRHEARRHETAALRGPYLAYDPDEEP